MQPVRRASVPAVLSVTHVRTAAGSAPSTPDWPRSAPLSRRATPTLQSSASSFSTPLSEAAARLTDAIIPRTPQNVVDKVYDALACLDLAFRARGINYAVFGGTVLGQVRHGGLIPWDDDADVVLDKAEIPQVRACREELLTAGYELTENYFGLRISPVDGIDRGDGIKLPFVDIFALDDYTYISDEAKGFWPQNPLPRGSLERTCDVTFGHLTLRGLAPADARQHLDENYGADWGGVAYRVWDHMNSCEVEPTRVELRDFTCARRSGT